MKKRGVNYGEGGIWKKDQVPLWGFLPADLTWGKEDTFVATVSSPKRKERSTDGYDTHVLYG